MKLTKKIDVLMDSIKMWEYLAKSGGKHKYEALVAVGLNRTMRNYCPLCHAVAEESKEEGIPFAENINQQCRTHCPMSLSDWYGELDDKTRSTYRRVPICETFTEGSLWQDWLNALNKHERLNAAAEMVRAFKEKARELTSELLLDLNGDYSLVSAKLVWAMKLPLKHKLEYLKEHGAELCGEDAAFALREVFGVEIGDTIRVHYLSAQSTGPHAIPGGAEKKFHDNETTATYTISAIKDGSIYINGNTRKGEGHSGSSSRSGLFHFFLDADRIEKLVTTEVVKPAVEVMKALVYHGYTCDNKGIWIHGDKSHFIPQMWNYCGKPRTNNGYRYEPEWLETELGYTTIYTKEEGSSQIHSHRKMKSIE